MRNLWATLAVVGALLGPQASAQQVLYYGGPVVSNANVVLVFWSSGVDATVQSGMPGFYAAVVNSTYLDWVSEYSTVGLNGSLDGLAGSNQRIGRGTFQNTYTITPNNSATNLSDVDVGVELTAQVAAGKLPTPLLDAQGFANTIYMVYFPSTITITVAGSASCVVFCAAAGTATIGGQVAGFGLFPDISVGGCATGCGTKSTPFDNVTANASEILLNMVTDVDVGLAQSSSYRPLAWYDLSHGQVADICNQQYATVGSYTVNKGWSNRSRECIASAGTALTVCDGSSTYCRQCTAADNGQATGCTGSRAVCEVTSSNTAFGECVACTASADCAGTTPVCSKGAATNDTCSACTADPDCSGNSAGPHCLASGACGAAVVADGGSTPDAGTHPDGGSGGGGSSSSGCSSIGGAPLSVPVLLFLLAQLVFAARRRSRQLVLNR
jgi:hypothetical protein